MAKYIKVGDAIHRKVKQRSADSGEDMQEIAERALEAALAAKSPAPEAPPLPTKELPPLGVSPIPVKESPTANYGDPALLQEIHKLAVEILAAVRQRGSSRGKTRTDDAWKADVAEFAVAEGVRGGSDSPPAVQKKVKGVGGKDGTKKQARSGTIEGSR